MPGHVPGGAITHCPPRSHAIAYGWPHIPPHGSHASPQALPAQGSAPPPMEQVSEAAAVQLPAPSHAHEPPIIIEQSIIIDIDEHGTPHAWSMHESTALHEAAPPATQFPPKSHCPAATGARHGGSCIWQGSAMTQDCPHVFPAQASATSHVKIVDAGTHSPRGSQTFRSALSVHPASPGAHRVHASAHAFPPHGS